MNKNTSVNSVIDTISSGGIAAFPTDTVYGIAALPFNKKAVQKLYKIKGRSDKKPIALLVSSKSQVKRFARRIPSKAKQLINKYWPGALTIIFPKKRLVPDFLTAGFDTIGIRMPKNKIALKIIKTCGGALAVTSANRSGKKPAVSAKEILGIQGIDTIIDGGKCKVGIPSSVVLVAGNKLEILRKGSVKL